MALLVATPGRGESPEELVRWLYTSLAGPGPADAKGLSFITAPGQRGTYLTRRMVAFYEANESYGSDLMMACVDFAFDIPGQDYDAEEIARTLAVGSEPESGRIVVTASFTNFGEPASVVYEFIPEDGFWRLDDIAGPGWRVSEIPCDPKVDSSSETRGTGYCYQSDADVLKLDVGGSGRALFEFESWQANGHSCSGRGVARPIEGGWAHEAAASEGPCRIEILVTDEGGLRLTDKDWACKQTMCGARAVIDGLTFPRSSQIDCALLPEG